jgi:hypothetical protein
MPTSRTALGAAVAALPLGALLYTSIASAVEPAGVAAAASAGHRAAAATASPVAVDLPAGGTWQGAASREQRLGAASRSASPHEFGSVAYNKWFAREYMAQKYGWGADQFAALEQLWQRESGWSQHAHNSSSGAHGIPQALPGSKMGSFGADWATNPQTQIKWGLSYIKSVYGSPSGALASSHSRGWY